MTDEFGDIILKKPEAYITVERGYAPWARTDIDYLMENIKLMKERLNTLDMWSGDCIAVLTNLKPGKYAVDESGGPPDFMPWDKAIEYFCDVGNMAIPVTVKRGYYEKE
jgi:hypothetical protein